MNAKAAISLNKNENHNRIVESIANLYLAVSINFKKNNKDSKKKVVAVSEPVMVPNQVYASFPSSFTRKKSEAKSAINTCFVNFLASGETPN